ncbi:unnamed protein product [Hymenolepis diminuta]|uniref:Uncharacterized protein n=1 Tax=Hymenolepis diminuta TaxID=6216 RepID=A0A564YA19_HYMDI|nr:unnamed protein product [Hymenolepis diminuta]
MQLILSVPCCSLQAEIWGDSPSDKGKILEEETEETMNDSPGPRPSFSDMNGTLLTENLSTDSLETRRSRLSTSLEFENSRLYSVNLNVSQDFLTVRLTRFDWHYKQIFQLKQTLN